MIGERGLGSGLGEPRGACGQSHGPISVASRDTLPIVLLVCGDQVRHGGGLFRHSGGLFRDDSGINLNKQGSKATHKLDRQRPSRTELPGGQRESW